MPETQVQSLGCKEPLEGENGNPLQDSCLGNPVNREACWTAVVGWQRVRNRMESPKINTCTYSQSIYEKVGKKIKWRKASLLNKWSLENQTATCKMRIKHFTPYTKINSKLFKDLNLRTETLTVLEENIGRILFTINCSNIFWISLLRQ